VVDRVARRIRSWLGVAGQDAGTVAGPEWIGPEAREANPSSPSVQPIPPPLPTAVAELGEQLTSRMAGNRALCASLTDEEVAPLREWADRRVAALVKSSARLAPGPAERYFNNVAGRLLTLMQTIDLAMGQRATVSAELVESRFQLLDTLLIPPLLDGPTAQHAQAWLAALLARPAEELKGAGTAALIRELIEVLELH
jgi:hypothetical protein